MLLGISEVWQVGNGPVQDGTILAHSYNVMGQAATGAQSPCIDGDADA